MKNRYEIPHTESIPTTEELHAAERLAQRLRGQEMARFYLMGLSALRSLFRRGASALRTKEIKHA